VKRLLGPASLLVVLSGLAVSCGGGDKCDPCAGDADCDSSKGFVCERYQDDVRRCGDPVKRFDRCPAEK
jgi:hypothetical protein